MGPTLNLPEGRLGEADGMDKGFMVKGSWLRVHGSRFQDSGFKKFKELKKFKEFKSNFYSSLLTSAIQASLIALTAPKVHSSLFALHFSLFIPYAPL